MSSRVAHSWERFRRNGRVLLRHVRFGLAGRAAREAALVRLFRGVNTHLRTLGVDYWLAYGTLLGWHREGRILAHDYDVDFGLMEELYPRLKASAAQLPRGFTMHDTSHRHLGPKLYIEHQGWEADLYFFRANGASLHMLEKSPNPGEIAPFPRSWMFPLQSAAMLGEPTFVPAQTLPYLVHTYGYIGPDAVRDPVTRYFRPRQA
jgi:hypothetical protein